MDFSVNPALAPYETDYLDFLQKNIQQQLDMGRKVILLSFCQFEGDERTIHMLQKQYPQITALTYDGTNYAQVCRTIGSAACMIASRFHSMVLALAYGVPTIAISYSNKTKQLLQDLGYGEFAITPDILAHAQPQVIPSLDVTPWAQLGESHFQALDHLLK